MSIFSSLGEGSYPRPQAKRIAGLVTQEGSAFHGAVLGKRREGKTDLLRQIHALLFEMAEGPIPFFYTYQPGRKGDALARHLVAAFCMQVRAFLMRQDDLLLEPPASLEQELERPGLPLSLLEMARNFVALNPAHQLEFAATMPAQFAYREARPVCLLFDDVQQLEPVSPSFAVLDRSNLCWILSGRDPFLSRTAGAEAWPVVRVEPFSAEEALLQTQKHCQASGLRFTQQLWERWCEKFGSSLWLMHSLVTAAAVQDQPLDSMEQLARLYVQELTSGTLGNWLSARLEQAIPDRSDRAMAGEFLAEMARSGTPPGPSSLPSRVWDGLVSEEWAEETLAGPRLLMDTLQRDWLSLATGAVGAPRERAKSRMLATFLLRAEQPLEHPASSAFFGIVRQRLLDLPQAGFPESFVWEGQEIRPPKIISVCAEATPAAELFWCYGSHANAQETPGSPVILLIAVCAEPPSEAQVQKWQRRLASEAELFLSAESRPAGTRPSIPLRELWVAVPLGTSLNPTGSERRFSWEVFSLL